VGRVLELVGIVVEFSYISSDGTLETNIMGMYTYRSVGEVKWVSVVSSPFVLNNWILSSIQIMISSIILLISADEIMDVLWLSNLSFV
jgi:hypothetical protein